MGNVVNIGSLGSPLLQDQANSTDDNKKKKDKCTVVNYVGVGDSLRDIISDASMAHCKVVSVASTVLFLRNLADKLENSYKG